MSAYSLLFLRSMLLAAPMLLLAACNPTEEESKSELQPVRPVKTIVVEPTATKLTRTYSAVILPAQEVELSFRVSGRIVEHAIRSGLEVEKGDVVAQLDARDFKAEVTRVESQLEQAQSQLQALTSGARSEDVASLEAAVAAAQAQVDAAKDQVSRSEQLLKRQVVAKAKVDSDLTALRVAEAELKAQEQELAKGRAGARAEDVAAQEAVIRGLKSQLQTLKDSLSDTTLTAPFAGIIAKRKVENFSNIQAKEPVATLQTSSTLNLAFDVPGPDVVRFAGVGVEDLELKVVLDSVPGRGFDAARSEFSTQADPATQTYRGRVAMENPDGVPVLPGMTGNVIVSTKENGAAEFLLPGSAIASEADGKAFVWVVSSPDNRVGKRSVMTGEALGANVAITDGLKEGDVVVTAGISALQDNMIVKPVSAIGE